MFHFLHQGQRSLPKALHQMSRNWHPQKSLIIGRGCCVDGKIDFTDVIWIIALCSSTDCCLAIPDTTQFGPLCHSLAALLPSTHSPNPTNLVQVIKYLHDIFKHFWARLQNCEERLSASLSLSVRQRRTTRLPPEAFREIWLSIIFRKFIHSFSSLSYDRSKASSKALHTVRSRASSFNWQYPLLSLRSSSSFLRLLPRLPVTYIPPFILPSIARCRRQFLRKMWSIQLAFRLLISCRIFLCSLILKSYFFISHMIGPTDLFHPSPAHFKTSQAFLIYCPKRPSSSPI